MRIPTLMEVMEKNFKIIIELSRFISFFNISVESRDEGLKTFMIYILNTRRKIRRTYTHKSAQKSRALNTKTENTQHCFVTIYITNCCFDLRITIDLIVLIVPSEVNKWHNIWPLK